MHYSESMYISSYSITGSTRDHVCICGELIIACVSHKKNKSSIWVWDLKWVLIRLVVTVHSLFISSSHANPKMHWQRVLTMRNAFKTNPPFSLSLSLTGSTDWMGGVNIEWQLKEVKRGQTQRFPVQLCSFLDVTPCHVCSCYCGFERHIPVPYTVPDLYILKWNNNFRRDSEMWYF